MTQLLHTHASWGGGPGITLAFVLVALIALAVVVNEDLTKKADLCAHALSNEMLRLYANHPDGLSRHERVAVLRERRRRRKIRTSPIGHLPNDPNCNCEKCH